MVESKGFFQHLNFLEYIYVNTGFYLFGFLYKENFPLLTIRFRLEKKNITSVFLPQWKVESVLQQTGKETTQIPVKII